MALNRWEKELVLECLDDRARWVRRAAEDQELLSEPCPPGRWRWAGPDAVPGAAERAKQHRDQLTLLTSARAQILLYT